MNFVQLDRLPFKGMSHEFVGQDHQAPISIYFVDAPPGRGPVLHTHPYVETVIVQEGRGRITVGDQERDLTAGDIVIIPPETPHRFVNTGTGPLRQIDIHGSARFIQTDLES
jgi:mannose-6-phosphate isomerase-like protein (cupin superfamily)